MFPHDLARWQVSLDSLLNQTISWSNLTNPGATGIIVDTGALPAGFYDVSFEVSVNVALAVTSIVFEYRDAANSASLWNLIYFTAGARSDIYQLHNIKVALNQRFRVYLYATFTGLASVGLIVTRRAI